MEVMASLGVPKPFATDIIIKDWSVRAQVGNPIYKTWWRKKTPCAGQEFVIANFEANGDTEQADKHRAELPKIAETTAGVVKSEYERFEALDEAGVLEEFNKAVKAAAIGSYYFSPTIFHKGSDVFMNRVFPQPEGLTLDALMSSVPLRDWDMAVKHHVRALGLDVTAHADMAGCETPLEKVLQSVREKAVVMPTMPNDLFDSSAEAFVGYFASVVPKCLGGTAPDTSVVGGDSAERRGWAAMVAHAAATGVQEQNFNGGFGQVNHNLLANPARHVDIMLYPLANFLMVGDIQNAVKHVQYTLVNNDSDDEEEQGADKKEKKTEKKSDAGLQGKQLDDAMASFDLLNAKARNRLHKDKSKAEDFGSLELLEDAHLYRVQFLLREVAWKALEEEKKHSIAHSFGRAVDQL